MPTAKASMLVAITAGIITVKPNSLLVPLHSPFRFSRIMLIPIMHGRNSATYLETASIYWRIVPPQIYPSVGISAWNPPKYTPAFWYSSLYRPKQRKRPLITQQQPVIGQAVPSPIGIPSFTGLSLCPIYNPFLCFFLLLNHFIVMAFFRKQFRMGSHFFNASLI